MVELSFAILMIFAPLSWGAGYTDIPFWGWVLNYAFGGGVLAIILFVGDALFRTEPDWRNPDTKSVIEHWQESTLSYPKYLWRKFVYAFRLWVGATPIYIILALISGYSG